MCVETFHSIYACFLSALRVLIRASISLFFCFFFLAAPDVSCNMQDL